MPANMTLTLFLPAVLMTMTLEIVLSSYKATSPKWTSKLAIGNTLVNLSWTGLILFALLNPQLLQPHVAHFFSEIFQKAPEDIGGQVHYILMGLGSITILVMLFDSYYGIRNSKTGK